MAAANGEASLRSESSSSSAGQIKDDYVLTRDSSASARLNLAHYIWLASFGYSLHPRIAENIRDRKNLKVADVGTGTGIWLLDLVQQLPKDAELDGIDISFAQCPPLEWRPRNVTLRLLDIFGEIPDELAGTYDVIHIRHFVCIVKSNDPAPLLTNLLRLLKPGGWLQWDEWDVLNRHFTKTRPDAPQENIDKLEAEFAIMRRHTPNPSWPPRLDDYFLEANMQSVVMEKRLSPPSHLLFMHDLTMLVFQELIDLAELKGLESAEKVKYLRQLLEGAIKEGREGAAWNLTRCMAVGRKSPY